MKNDEEIVLSSADAEALVLMLGERARLAASAGGVLDDLLEVLQTGYIAVASAMPEDRVTMNSRVTYVDAVTGEVQRLALVWPYDAAPEAGRVSILSPMGTALIGRRVGAAITIDLPRGATRSVSVTAVEPLDEAVDAATA